MSLSIIYVEVDFCYPVARETCMGMKERVCCYKVVMTDKQRADFMKGGYAAETVKGLIWGAIVRHNNLPSEKSMLIKELPARSDGTIPELLSIII